MSQTTVYKSKTHSKLSLAAFLILLIVSATGIALWRMQSVQIMSVESGSMTPTIRKGDAVVIGEVHKHDLKVGDIVSYRSAADQAVIITHRIVQVEPMWGLIVTKGDNTQRNDKPVPISEVIGKVNIRVTYLGYVLNFLRSPVGLITSVYLPALVIVGLELKRLAGYYRKPTYRLAGYAKH